MDFPELVSMMLLGSTAARANDTLRAVIWHWIKLAEKGDRRALNLDFAEKIYSAEFYEKYREFISAAENDVLPRELARFVILARACESFDIYDELDKIKCPVLVIGAENDRVLDVEASQQIARKMGCDIYVYGKYGHAVYDEAEDYKDRIMRFFNTGK